MSRLAARCRDSTHRNPSMYVLLCILKWYHNLYAFAITAGYFRPIPARADLPNQSFLSLCPRRWKILSFSIPEGIKSLLDTRRSYGYTVLGFSGNTL